MPNSCVLIVNVSLCITMCMYYMNMNIFLITSIQLCTYCVSVHFLCIVMYLIHFSVYYYVTLYFACAKVLPHMYLCICVSPFSFSIGIMKFIVFGLILFTPLSLQSNIIGPTPSSRSTHCQLYLPGYMGATGP